MAGPRAQTASTAVAGEPATRTRPSRRGSALTPRRVRLASLVVFLTAWELYGRSVSSLIFTPPSAVARAAAELVASGELWSYSRESLVVLVYGVALAAAVGVAFGLLMGRVRLVEWVANPYVNAFYATPMVALVPLLVLWLGYGLEGKTVVVFLFAVFPLLINVYQGVKSVDPQLLEVAAAFCARERHVWWHLILPSVVPYLLAGLRLALGRALVGVIIADFYTSVTGLGYMILKYGNNFQVDRMMVPVAELAVVAVVLLGLMQRLERRLAPWLYAGR